MVAGGRVWVGWGGKRKASNHQPPTTLDAKEVGRLVVVDVWSVVGGGWLVVVFGFGGWSKQERSATAPT